jgi:hypothetical protein
MIYPLLKTWLKPLFNSVLSSNQTAVKHPPGFQTIGGGDGTPGAGRRRKGTSSKSHVTGSLSFSESEERIVNNVKMQNLQVSARPAESTSRPSKGIIVSSEFQIANDDISQKDDHNTGYVHESW